MLFGMATSAVSSPPLVAVPARLELTEVNDRRLVFLNGHLISDYAKEDLGTERVLATQLAETVPLKGGEIAEIFGMHPVSLSRIRSQARQGGAAALMPRRRGPKGPSKVNARLERRIHEFRQEGLSTREIARRVSRPGRTLTHVSVAKILKRSQSEPSEEPLPLELPEATVEEPTVATLEKVGDEQSSRYAGALLVYVALEMLGLFRVFKKLGASVGPARRFGWREAVAAVIFSFVLRFRSIEDTKNARRRDLGVLLGQSCSPTVLSLRTKIGRLTESVDPVSLSRELFAHYLSLEPVWEGLYYVDGHFCPYYGQQPTPKGWDPHRRLAAKGHTDSYVHDAQGRVLFFLSQPLNNSLARAVPLLVEEIRRVHGEGRFTLVFDRGGYSGKLFHFLTQEGIGFITYLKGRKKRRQIPAEKFRASWFHFEGKRQVYRVHEKRTRVSDAGLLRTILFLDDEGQQIPVLTNVDSSFQPAKVVHCLRLRWRQENSFKYLREHYGIDQIIQYGAEPEKEGRRLPNPKRKALRMRMKAVEDEIEGLEAQLGRTLDQNEEAKHSTTRGIKIANSSLRRQLTEKRQLLARLESRLRHTPSQIDAEQIGKNRFLLREDRRLLVNALKLVAYNAERLLALRFNKHYDQRKDLFSVFRSILLLAGDLRRVSPERLDVRLQRPDSPKVAAALNAFLQEINQHPPRMLGDGPTLQFALQS